MKQVGQMFWVNTKLRLKTASLLLLLICNTILLFYETSLQPQILNYNVVSQNTSVGKVSMAKGTFQTFPIIAQLQHDEVIYGTRTLIDFHIN